MYNLPERQDLENRFQSSPGSKVAIPLSPALHHTAQQSTTQRGTILPRHSFLLALSERHVLKQIILHAAEAFIGRSVV